VHAVQPHFLKKEKKSMHIDTKAHEIRIETARYIAVSLALSPLERREKETATLRKKL